jgi:hypothetical protein
MVKMKSNNLLNVYTKWTKTASVADIELVDAVYLACEENYEAGGDVVVECYKPDRILECFKSVEDAKRYCGLWLEAFHSASCTDPELEFWKFHNSLGCNK